MPGTLASRRRPFNTRGRSSNTPKRRAATTTTTTTQALEAAAFSEPPPKRRRYIPGGPGGGGRYIENEGNGQAVASGNSPVGLRGGSHSIIANGTTPLQPSDFSPIHKPSPSPREYKQTPRLAYERPRRQRRSERPPPKPRYSSAAAATAAMVQGDGFKPREERGWEEFHQDLEIEADLPCYNADEVDGLVGTDVTNGVYTNGTADVENGTVEGGGGGGTPGIMLGEDFALTPQGFRRRPGRPFRRPDSMLKGIGTPEAPKVIPPPGPNPRERLTLPKPSFRRVDPFASYEKTSGSQDYVDRTMASVGYQESDLFPQPIHYIRLSEGGIEDDLDLHTGAKIEDVNTASIAAMSVKRVEYDMDEQDQKWLEEYNRRRREDDVEAIKPAIFEVIMSFIEKEWHALEKRIPKPNPKPPQTHRPRSSSAAAVNGEATGQGEEQDSKCAICDDGDCENTNAIVFCDGCDLAVHQECYGVPFIPEGQWLCRKCRVIGSGVPTCIFCPNMDGAFKQTNSSKWAHLLCAIWIPEVSLGNTTFMEPVMDVEKVPRPRWRLTCTICNQKMGACIQCGNKNCFRAFHVTCGRKAKWFLQMKSAHGGPATLDASVLKAFCNKHVPNEWRKNNDVDGATADAVQFYRYHMRGKIWANSHQAATTLQAAHRHVPSVEEPTGLKINLVLNKGKKKAPVAQKATWRLPSGAPVIPSLVYDSVEGLLQRFAVRKRKEFASDMCKYWTLKREARRGAPLIKRLQLQMEMFSSMEITRRDFAAMGAAGGPRLQRRKEFTQLLQRDGEGLKQMSELVVQKQKAMVENDDLLDVIINTVYFPIGPLLRPIIDKALTLNGKGYFLAGLWEIRERVLRRYYTAVYPFSADLGSVFAQVIGMPSAADTAEVQSQIIGDRSARKDLTHEQKEKRKLAKRIIKSIEPALNDAMRKESDLCKVPYEQELPRLDLLEMSIPSRQDSVIGDTTNGVAGNESIPVLDIDMELEPTKNGSTDDAESNHPPTTPAASTTPSNTRLTTTASQSHSHPHPPTPPLSSSSTSTSASSSSASAAAIALSTGGTPWYMISFDPSGTTVSEERWTGRDATRSLSEELSDMDDEELSGLVDEEMDVGREADKRNGVNGESSDAAAADIEAAADDANGSGATGKVQRKKNGKMKKRWRGFR